MIMSHPAFFGFLLILYDWKMTSIMLHCAEFVPVLQSFEVHLHVVTVMNFHQLLQEGVGISYRNIVDSSYKPCRTEIIRLSRGASLRGALCI